MMKPRALRIAPLLFGSGLCALVYQIAWQREFRLVFGASTAASAAVLAIFIGGLGLGGLLLGRYADRAPRPLTLYAGLEAGVAVSAAVTPFLLDAVRAAYVALGGTPVLGNTLGTLIRLALAALVLGIPTLLMGGTLPAAARAAETEDDRGRRDVGLLYGVNTLGAVTGAVLATFFMLEHFGTRQTLWMGALLNLLVAVVARSVARELEAGEGAETAPSYGRRESDVVEPESPAVPTAFVLFAAGLVGFAFFLMELVWYRMLGPLLGGTIFTFGLILATALFGIGLGGAWYSLRDRQRAATLAGFAGTCLLEALFIALPYALGDRIALLAMLLRPLGQIGFGGYLLSWGLVTAMVVLPAAFIAGVQFPTLIALLGRGREGLGRQIGLTYAWNTVGAILGSLAGGFGLLPLLTATGCWRLVAALLTGLGVLSILLSLRIERRASQLLVPAATAAVICLLLTATGPTSAWRHSPIGAGRVSASAHKTPNALEHWLRNRRRAIVWQAEGIESSVALDKRVGLAFIVNGKIDGNAIGDRATQVMGGLIGSMLQPHTRKAMVIGLGTGSTAGWLGAIDEVERVDAIELEPAILEVARACAPVNHGVLDNPKVKIHLGDAREVLLTTPERYDLIFSEPSNPYRAGIASLFTEEFYQAAKAKLEPGGLFLQWLQAYEVDGPAVRSVYATLARVFPHVETWQLSVGDLVLVASAGPLTVPVDRLRDRIGREPWRSALLTSWRTTELEGVLARFIAGPGLTQLISKAEGDFYNTDDRTWIEFGFARTLGRFSIFHPRDVLAVAAAHGMSRSRLLETGVGAGAGPTDSVGAGSAGIDWDRVAELRAQLFEDPLAGISQARAQDALARINARAQNKAGELLQAGATWATQPLPPMSPDERVIVAEARAEAGDPAAREILDQFPSELKAEALGIEARFHLKRGDVPAAAQALEAAIRHYQQVPWAEGPLMQRSLMLAEEIADRDRAAAQRLFDLLLEPFAVQAIEFYRMGLVFNLLDRVDFPKNCGKAMALLEPDFPLAENLMQRRIRCYQAIGDPRLELAKAELERLLEREPAPFSAGLVAPGGGSTSSAPAGASGDGGE